MAALAQETTNVTKTTTLINFSTKNTGETAYWNHEAGGSNEDYLITDGTVVTTTGATSNIVARFNDPWGLAAGTVEAIKDGDSEVAAGSDMDNVWESLHGAKISPKEISQTFWQQTIDGALIGGFGDLSVSGLTTVPENTMRTYVVSVYVAREAGLALWQNSVTDLSATYNGQSIALDIKEEQTYVTTVNGTIRFDEDGLDWKSLRDTQYITLTWIFDAPVDENGDPFNFSLDFGGILLGVGESVGIGALGITQIDGMKSGDVSEDFEDDITGGGGWHPAVPEPTTATLSLLALTALAARRRRK